MKDEFLYEVYGILEADFINLNLTRDLKKFLDPFKISRKNNEVSKKMKIYLSDFFQIFVENANDSSLEKACDLLRYLHEPRENRLGYAENDSDGNSVDKKIAYKFYIVLKEYPLLMKDGVIGSFEDFSLHVDYIGDDRTSDITTRIVYEVLASYTAEQCARHGIETVQTSVKKTYWDLNTHSWREAYFNLPVFNGREILFTPEELVSEHVSLANYDNFVEMGILNYYRKRYYITEIGDLQTFRNKKDKVRLPTRDETRTCLKNRYGDIKKPNFFYSLVKERRDSILEYYKHYKQKISK